MVHELDQFLFCAARVCFPEEVEPVQASLRTRTPSIFINNAKEGLRVLRVSLQFIICQRNFDYEALLIVAANDTKCLSRLGHDDAIL
ncbi:hypothetical protein D3C84_1129240 [compost metagenome]